MNEKDLELLEFPQVREILADFTSFSASRELALKLRPVSDAGQIALLLRQSTEARHLLSLELGFSTGSIKDVSAPVKMASKGKVLEPQRLLEVQETLAVIRQLRERLEKFADEVPSLWKIARNLVAFGQLEKEILKCVSPSGEVMDNASPELAAIRGQLKQVRQQLLEELKVTMDSPQGRKLVQQPVITEREGRYVIPVKIERRHDIKGIVHDISNSEATAFIEPLITVEMGNIIRELAVEEDHEVERILRGLSVGVGSNEAKILYNISLAAELDLALAKARYASNVKAAEPILTQFNGNDAPVLKLLNARHPLLTGRAVPLSIEIGRDFSILVITGPNTGGKTVALKTIGLLSLMAQAGMPIPASPESRIPVFDGIYADIGDEQSIEQTLSTFSWHMSNITRIIDSANEKSLVLLDELGTNTDPSEGSALARAILQYLLSRGIMAVTTTHYSDLKAFAHVTVGLENASFEFDNDTLMPTYHLTLGIPGGSNAIATAARIGLSAGIIEAARNMLTEGSQELEALLAYLAEEKDRQEALGRNLDKEKEAAEKLKARLEIKIKKLVEEKNSVIQDVRDKVTSEAAALHHEIQQALAGLRKERTEEKTEKARQTLAKVRTKLKSFQPKPEAGGKSADEDVIRVGDTVRLKQANVLGTVTLLSEEKGQLEVHVGQVSISLGLDGVEKVVAEDINEEAAPQVAARQASRGAVPNELDLRGRRADEIEPAIDSYLNDAFMANLSQVRIIHGFGTGTVRQISRDFLAFHPLVKTSRPGGRGEGGDGITVVQL